MLVTDIDLASPDFFVPSPPHEALRLLREHDPVHWQPEPPPNHGFWAVTRYHDLEAVMRDPFGGVGNPEPLKYLGTDIWSRRITQEHRLVYVVSADRIDFIQARYHYQ